MSLFIVSQISPAEKEEDGKKGQKKKRRKRKKKDRFKEGRTDREVDACDSSLEQERCCAG